MSGQPWIFSPQRRHKADHVVNHFDRPTDCTFLIAAMECASCSS